MGKKGDNKYFNLSMGSFNDAEICELIGLYMLYLLNTQHGRNRNGIYRDDG